MNPAQEQTGNRANGFSLIEVMLALVLVASALITLMALVPVGLRSSQDATNSMIVAHILEDAHERLEGQALVDGTPENSPFFYDNEGIFVSPGDASEIVLERRLYRVDIRLVSPIDQTITNNAPGLKAVILNVAWPVDPVTGDVPGDATGRYRKSITYHVNALTGPGWSKAEPKFIPLIEF